MGRPKRPGNYVRINLDMPEDVKNRLNELRDETRASSLAMVLERALAVYDYVYEQEKTGGQVVVKDASGSEERLKLWP